MECSKCGASGDKVRLFDAIQGAGIVKLCEHCANADDLPVIKRPTTEQLKMAESNTSVRKMLTKMSSGRAALEERYSKDKRRFENQEISLRDLVERNYKDSPKRSIPRPDLIDNFHWVIMRARRSKKVSYKQLAEAISESEAAVQMAEKGILPEDDNKLITKLETYFGVRLVKETSFEKMQRARTSVREFRTIPKQPAFPQPEAKKELLRATPVKFDSFTSKNLTISDLQDIKKKKDEREKKFETPEPEKKGLKLPDEFEDGDISQEEMDRILFGK